MPDVWELVKEASSLEYGDFWEHLNSLENSAVITEVVGNINGTVITTFNITGSVELVNEILGVVVEEDNIAGIVTEDDISAEIETNNLEGKIT